MANLIYPELSFKVVGLCFVVHNELGVYAKEKQYADLLERKLIGDKVTYKREQIIGDSGNIADFIIDDKILLELKAKRIITRDDYYQTQRYLQETRLKLGIIVNFRDRTIHPKRVVRIDKKN
ncbi:MAG TPA: GxxExxY protein [Candidatus Paceibacterota bacterium]